MRRLISRVVRWLAVQSTYRATDCPCELCCPHCKRAAIAAAPTLLEALSEIVAERDRVIAEESAMSPIGQPMFDDSFGIKLARAALAAAEGGAK